MTNDLLESVTNEDLHKSPDESLGPWWKQFRHMGRVQENYLQAVESGTVQFGFEGASYNGGASKIELQKYLINLDNRLAAIIKNTDVSLKINWFGENKSLGQHLMYLADHEVLHHGQWIIYRRQLGGVFPPSWSAWDL